MKRRIRTRRTRRRRGGAATVALNIRYGNVAVKGQDFTKDATGTAPKVVVPPGHFLIMWDRNAAAGTYLHWIQDATTAIVPYEPPSPPAGTGKHNYIFRLIEGVPQIVPKKRAPVDLDAIIGAQTVKSEAGLTVFGA